MTTIKKAEPKRLDQIMSNLGYCSRKEANLLAKDGRITVDGKMIKTAAVKVDPYSVLFDDEPLEHPESILVMLNKPVDYVCSHDASEGFLIYDLLPRRWMQRKPQLMSIGRLDKDTSGLILITDIGNLVHDFTTPKKNIEKYYNVELDKPLEQKVIALFASGTIRLDEDDKPCLPAKLDITGTSTCRVILTEGKYRQIRRMFGSLGYEVIKLHRSQFGPYLLNDLAPGKYVEVPVL